LRASLVQSGEITQSRRARAHTRRSKPIMSDRGVDLYQNLPTAPVIFS
jgi:hypothetical protein